MLDWSIAQIFDTILRLFIESVKKLPIRITRNPKEKIRSKPISPILGREEDGKWIFRYAGKEYNTGKSTSIHKIGYEGTPYHFGKIIYRTNKRFWKRFFVVEQNHFWGEFSKTEIQVLLDINRAPKEAYEKAGIKLKTA